MGQIFGYTYVLTVNLLVMNHVQSSLEAYILDSVGSCMDCWFESSKGIDVPNLPVALLHFCMATHGVWIFRASSWLTCSEMLAALRLCV